MPNNDVNGSHPNGNGARPNPNGNGARPNGTNGMAGRADPAESRTEMWILPES